MDLPTHYYLAVGREYGTGYRINECGLTAEQAKARAMRAAAYGGLDLWGVDKAPIEYATPATREKLAKLVEEANAETV